MSKVQRLQRLFPVPLGVMCWVMAGAHGSQPALASPQLLVEEPGPVDSVYSQACYLQGAGAAPVSPCSTDGDIPAIADGLDRLPMAAPGADQGVSPLLSQDAQLQAPEGLQRGTEPGDATAPPSPLADPELGVIQIGDMLADPELGVLNIRNLPVAVPPATTDSTSAYFSARLGFISSDNIFYTADPTRGTVGDELLRAGISLSFFPSLGPETFFVGAVDANVQRYATESSSDYDEVRVRLGLRQTLSSRSYGQLSWNYQQLFRPGLQDRFFENRSAELLLGRRDPLSSRLSVDSYYRAQFNYSEPVEFDRVVQLLGITGNYYMTRRWQTSVSYQLTFADYIRVQRYDTYHQLIGQLTYRWNDSTRINLFGGFTFGRSSVDSVRFSDTLYGISIESTLPLF